MKKKFQLGTVLIISTAHLCNDIYASFLSPLLPLLINKLGISISMAGLLDVVRNIPSLFNPLVGIMADRVSVRYFVILAPSITAVTMSLLGLSPSYGIILITLFISGIGSTLFHVPAPVMIKRVAADRTGTGMSLFMLGGELSRTLGPLIITAAVSIWGLEGTFRLMPFGLAASAVLFVKVRNLKLHEHVKRDESTLKAWSTFKKHRSLFISISGFILFTSALKLPLTLYLPAYLVHQGKSLWSASFSLSLLQLAGAAGTFSSGFVADKMGMKTTLLISAIATPLLMWLFLSLDSKFTAPLLFALGFFLFAPNPVLLAVVQDTGSDHPSFMNGVYMTIMFGISSLMTLLVGNLVDTVGFDLTYRMAVFISAAALPFIFFIPENRNRAVQLTE